MVKKQLPKILNKRIEAKSKLFTIESVDLRFSNNVERTYERIKLTGDHGVMVIPITKSGDLLLVREYAVGTENYQLGFPKGLIDEGETAKEAANRELKEEIGFGGNQFTFLKELVMAPSYFSSKMILFVAQDLYVEKLKGDEPESLDIIRWPVAQASELLNHIDFSEARNIVALLLTLQFLEYKEELYG